MRRVHRMLLIASLVTITLMPNAAHAVDDLALRKVRLEPKQVQAAGTTWAYAELGTGRPLVLLNGTGSPMAEWDPALLAGLSAQHRVIVFDYPGLGLSGPAPARWRFDRAADWTSQFITALLPGTAVDVLGWSMGGFVAQQLAIRHPELVDALVLAGTNPGGARAVLGPTWVQEADSAADESIATYLRTNYPRNAKSQAAGRAFVHRLTVAVNSGAYPEEDVPTRTYNAMVDAEDPWLRSNANWRALPSITAPTLVITGDSDVITPPVNSRSIAAAIPGSRLQLVRGAGHSFLFQFPDRVAETVNGFLATAGSRR